MEFWVHVFVEWLPPGSGLYSWVLSSFLDGDVRCYHILYILFLRWTLLKDDSLLSYSWNEAFSFLSDVNFHINTGVVFVGRSFLKTHFKVASITNTSIQSQRKYIIITVISLQSCGCLLSECVISHGLRGWYMNFCQSVIQMFYQEE